jgi:hypothetical protein
MLRDNSQRSRSRFTHSSFFAKRKPPPLIPSLVVGTVFLLALLLLTVPNWGEFARNISQFPVLWQVSSNRREIIFLLIRVCSPLLLAAIAGACCWVWYTIKEYLRQETLPAPVQLQGSIQPSSPVELGSSTSPSKEESERRAELSLPLTPIPYILSDVPADQESIQQTRPEEEREEEHAELEGSTQEQSPFWTMADAGTDPMSDAEELELPKEQKVPDADATQPPVSITITVLKEVSMTLHVPGRQSYRVPLHLNAKEIQLVAYLAWLDAQSKGQTISLDKLREHIFGYGRPDEDATPKKLQDALDSAKKEIRRQLRQASQQVNKEVGNETIPPNLDIFAIRNKRYGLSQICHVSDLALLEAQHQLIQQAFDEGLLADSIPQAIKQACDRLRKAYAGDFLADLLHESPEEVGTWARRPFTLYRDYFLQAVLYAAEFELRAGQELADEHLDDEGRRQKSSGAGSAPITAAPPSCTAPTLCAPATAALI